MGEAGDSLLRAAMSQLNLSARAYNRILKLARTVADQAGSEGSRRDKFSTVARWSDVASSIHQSETTSL